ncbi:thioredoxin domain-containing protein [Trichloromonas sp.]|uniref:thioredoxin domain-containing protein n=1 Tax=Trichloromonas sp. TaxID=3069249 RepID=UPI003D81751A
MTANDHADPTARLSRIDTRSLPEDGGPEYNRLIFEKSPYLLQHADNPVDWFPWGDDAFARARRENKPVFLSIGYSTCHWCHVMAHESFEHPDAAAVLKRGFIAIKVDREERPDIDQAYMTACQMLTGSGGWPLTLVLTPDKEPFFAATYLPRQGRSGMAGLIDILQRIDQAWRTDQAGIRQSSSQITRALLEHNLATGDSRPLVDTPLKDAADDYQKSFDREFGGFGSAPKFPSAHNLSLLLRLARRFNAPPLAQMALQTLRRIRRGGIYDQIGHGIHRYSVDRQWVVPHFEKMLYDQAMLILACIDAFQYSGEADFCRTALETAGYVCGDLLDPGGAFHSGEDADSEGAEGTFYVWTPAQVHQVLGPEAGTVYCRTFSIDETGNFEGKSIPVRHEGLEELAQKAGVEPDALAGLLEESREKLLAARHQRLRPHRDDKVLTAWNGLAIAALAKAGAVFGRPELIEAARRAAGFILGRLRRPDGRLLRRWRQNDAAVPAFLEDYSFLAWGLFELYQAGFHTRDLRTALELTEQMLELFDDGQDGLYDTGKDAEAVLDRGRSLQDGALPSGGSVAALNLLRLGRLCSRTDLEQRGERLLQNGMARFASHPQAYAQHLIALDTALSPPTDIVLACGADVPTAAPFLAALLRKLLPEASLILSRQADPELTALAPAAAGKPPIGGKTTAYVCRNRSCQAPATTVEEMLRQLEENPS